MCGIAGILNLDGKPADRDEVLEITRALAHRGPDGEGIHLDGPLGLGHRRLAILDLSDTGQQPMPCVEGRYWITFNGEIYNFIEIRKELASAGYRFTSDSDTEIIGAAYDRWGAACVLKFNGMWAFALWDTRTRELFLSRDRFGVKPLNYLAEPRRFAFASELKGFLKLRGFSAREDEQAVSDALASPDALETADDTILLGVKRLLPGHSMLVTADRTRVWRWWNTLEHLEQPPRKFADQVERFRELFDDSCRLRLRSDVPIATCLSGGLDSSSVICTLAGIRAAQHVERQTQDSQRAFVATFPGTPLDERAFAELAIARAGAEPRYRQPDQQMALEALYRYTYDFESVGKNLMIQLWWIYQEVRGDGVAVSLDGNGADELLGGYRHYVAKALRRQRSLLDSPRRNLDLARTLYGIDGGGLQASLAIAGFVLPTLRAAKRSLRAKLGPWVLPGPAAHGQVSAEEEEAAALLGPIGSQLYHEFHYTRLPNMLRSWDRCSMAHGVEVRMPFLDWRLVCCAFGLPDESKIGGGFTKRILREAMRGVLPEPVRRRRDKIGFQSPMSSWFNGALGDWVWDQVCRPSFLDSRIWNGPAIRDFVDARHRNKSWGFLDCSRVWPFLQAHLWQETFFAGARSGPMPCAIRRPNAARSSLPPNHGRAAAGAPPPRGR